MAKDGSKGNRWIDPRFTPLTLKKYRCYIHLDDGSFMAVDGNATVTSTDGGVTWSAPRPIYRGPGPELPEPGPGIPSASGPLLRGARYAAPTDRKPPEATTMGG